MLSISPRVLNFSFYQNCFLEEDSVRQTNISNNYSKPVCNAYDNQP